MTDGGESVKSDLVAASIDSIYHTAADALNNTISAHIVASFAVIIIIFCSFTFNFTDGYIHYYISNGIKKEKKNFKNNNNDGRPTTNGNQITVDNTPLHAPHVFIYIIRLTIVLHEKFTFIRTDFVLLVLTSIGIDL